MEQLLICLQSTRYGNWNNLLELVWSRSSYVGREYSVAKGRMFERWSIKHREVGGLGPARYSAPK
jgi:hypothetical protein